MLSKEIWSPIPSSNGKYWASSLGRIMSYATSKQGKVLKPVRSGFRSGYLKASISENGIFRQKYIHRLVCEAFLGPSELEVNHKDGDKHNNRLGNLEYVTRSENELHKRGGKFGVSTFRKGFRARIWIDGKEKHLGCFDTEEEARLVREVEAKKRGMYVRS